MSTLASILLTVAAALIVAMLSWVARELVSLRVDLAIVRDQLLPAGEPSLRDTVNQHTTQLAVHTVQLAALARTTGNVRDTVSATHDTITSVLGES